MSTLDLSRRGAITIGGAGLTVAALAACSPSETETSPSAASPSSSDAASGAPTASPSAEAPAAGGTEVAKLADIPVGGSIDATLAGAPIVLAQPSAGTVVGYSAICTHQQCVVQAAGDEFDCPCHQSRFDAATGEPFPGSKALKPLPALTVTVSGDAVLAEG